MHIPAPRFYTPLRNAVAFAALALAASAWSQTAPVPPSVAPKTPLPEEKPLSMSPFEIRADADVGYQAGNTTSGSRFNSSLKDTPASISPFTPEFLSDIAATTVNEMMAYATNAELNAGDSEGAGFSAAAAASAAAAFSAAAFSAAAFSAAAAASTAALSAGASTGRAHCVFFVAFW